MGGGAYKILLSRNNTHYENIVTPYFEKYRVKWFVELILKIMSTNLKRPIFVLLFGAPGVGKGTYGKRIARDFNLEIFSTGDHFRALEKDPSRADDPIV